MSPARSRAPKGQGDRLATEILDAAEALLVEAGSKDRVSVRAIADAVGVTPPSLYLHFADKDELFVAVAERRFGQLTTMMQEAAADVSGHRERLAAMGQAYVRFGIERGAHYSLLFGPDCPVGEALQNPESAGAAGLYLLHGAVVEAIESGAIDSDDADATTMMLWAASHGVVMLFQLDHDNGDALHLGDPLDLGARMCRTMLYGLVSRDEPTD